MVGSNQGALMKEEERSTGLSRGGSGLQHKTLIRLGAEALDEVKQVMSIRNPKSGAAQRSAPEQEPTFGAEAERQKEQSFTQAIRDA